MSRKITIDMSREEAEKMVDCMEFCERPEDLYWEYWEDGEDFPSRFAALLRKEFGMCSKEDDVRR